MKDRDGYDCGTYIEGFALLFCEDDTVECFENTSEFKTIEDATHPVANGKFNISGQEIEFVLKRLDDPTKRDVITTGYDTYGPREPLSAIFASGTFRVLLGKHGISFVDHFFEFADGDKLPLSN